MKSLPKSMRQDYRYLSVKVDAELDKQKASEFIQDSVRSYAGDIGLAKTNPKIIDSESDFNDSVLVVRVNKEREDTFRASIALYDTKMCTLNVSGSSGSV